MDSLAVRAPHSAAKLKGRAASSEPASRPRGLDRCHDTGHPVAAGRRQAGDTLADRCGRVRCNSGDVTIGASADGHCGSVARTRCGLAGACSAA